MADVIPFRGLLYNPEKVGDLDKVTAPPYDVISPEFQNTLYERHPNNVVRLILGKMKSTDKPGDDRYSRAAGDLKKWLDGGVLVRDERPAIYYYTQSYVADGFKRTRKGFIALSRLEELGKGRIHAHESTLSGPKADRLKLMEACEANFSCIFSLFSEPQDLRPEERVISILESATDREPLIEAVDDDGVENRLWRITEPGAIRRVSAAMEGMNLFIADGHHRYETAVNFRTIMRKKVNTATGKEPFNYVMMYFSSMDDSGLVVMPTHRVIHSLKDFDTAEFLNRLKEYFDIEAIIFDNGSEVEARRSLYERMDKQGPQKTIFGLYIKGTNAYYVLTLKDDMTMERVFGDTIPEVFKSLDVTVLHSLVMEKVLGITKESQKKQENIIYVKARDAALEEARAKSNQLVFIMNPTRIDQVKAVAEAGYVMPQKSTYFYPKLLTGLVINPLGMEDALTLPQEL